MCVLFISREGTAADGSGKREGKKQRKKPVKSKGRPSPVVSSMSIFTVQVMYVKCYMSAVITSY